MMCQGLPDLIVLGAGSLLLFPCYPWTLESFVSLLVVSSACGFTIPSAFSQIFCLLCDIFFSSTFSINYPSFPKDRVARFSK